jgi:hypothetical protein
LSDPDSVFAYYSQCCGTGAEIKLPPGAGAEITNCGSGSSSGSFLIIKDLKEILLTKIMVAKEIFVNHYYFHSMGVQHEAINVKKYWYSSQRR